MKVPGTGLLKILLIVMLALLFAPLVVSQIGLQAGTAVDWQTVAVEALAPKLAALSLVVVGIALAAGVILHAFGHGHGRTMIKNSLVAAVVAIVGAAFFAWLSKQGPTIATDLVANVGTMISNAAARLSL